MAHKINRVYTDSAGLQTSYEETVPGTAETNIIAESIADGVTDGAVNFNADQSQLKSVLLVASVAMTLKTNSSGSPQETIALAAGVPKIWSLAQDLIGTCPFSGDVTALFVTNASGGAGTLTVKTAHDPTP